MLSLRCSSRKWSARPLFSSFRPPRFVYNHSMQRDVLKARIAKLPHLPAIAPTHSLGVNEDEDEEEEALDSFPELGAVKCAF